MWISATLDSFFEQFVSLKPALICSAIKKCLCNHISISFHCTPEIRWFNFSKIAWASSG